MSDAPFDLIGAADTFADGDWFHTCRETQTPYVLIRSGETSADVIWDFVTLPASCDGQLRAKFPDLEREARAIFDKFAEPESFIRVKPTLICFDRLSFDKAKLAAVELYGLINHYVVPPAKADSADDAIWPETAARASQSAFSRPTSRQIWIE